MKPIVCQLDNPTTIFCRSKTGFLTPQEMTSALDRVYSNLTKTVADGGARASARFDVNLLGGQ
jgi:hypothetical protein